MGRLRHFTLVGFLVSVGFMLLAATPSWAEVECGATIMPGEVAVLTKDLTCNNSTGSTALTLIGPKAVLLMKGHTVRCANIRFGIRLQGSGAVLVGGVFKHGTVTGCVRNGVEVTENGGHHITKVTATKNVSNGFLIRSSNNKITYTRSMGNNLRGYLVSGGVSSNTFKGNLAKDNFFGGFQLFGNAHVLTKNQALSNKVGDGFEINGKGHTLKGNVANDNGNRAIDNGFQINDDNNHLVGNRASGNWGSGFDISTSATGHLLKGNIAKKNQEHGIRLLNGATNNTLVGNIAVDNTLPDLRDDNEHCDENTWKFNWFKTSQTNPPDAKCIR